MKPPVLVGILIIPPSYYFGGFLIGTIVAAICVSAYFGWEKRYEGPFNVDKNDVD